MSGKTKGLDDTPPSPGPFPLPSDAGQYETRIFISPPLGGCQASFPEFLDPQSLRAWGVEPKTDGTLIFPWPSADGSRPLHIKKSDGSWRWEGYSSYNLRPFGIEKLGKPREIFVVESEADLLTLFYLGFSGIATGGASGWQVGWWGELPEGVPVVAWVEDEAGLKLLKHVVNSAPPGREVRVFSALGLPGKDAKRILEAVGKEGAMDLIQGRLWDARAVTVVNLRDELLERILDSLGRTTGPNPKGIYRSRCPFHDDKNPSFDVGLNGFKCWSPECGVQGSLELLGAYFGLLLQEKVPLDLEKKEAGPKPEPFIVPLADVTPEDIVWLWEPYIPQGKLTILEGDPGVGKTWLALTIAAVVSRGWPFPGEDGIPKAQREPANVLYLSAEDSLADTLRPRLDAADADVTRVFALTGWKCADPRTGKEETRTITLADLPVIEEALERVRPALFIVDPIQAYLGAGVDMHRANEVRPVLAGLAALADRYRCAVLCIRHLGKSPQDRAVYRGLGSIDFAAAARSILLVGQDPQDEGKRVLAQVKNSLAPLGTSLRFGFHDGRLLWCGASQVTAEALLAPPRSDEEKSALEEACEFLSEALSRGPRPADEVLKEARKLGISEITLRRAKACVGVKVYRRGEPGKRSRGTWWWDLADQREKPPLRTHYDHLNHSPQTVDTQGFAGKNLDDHMIILKNHEKHQQLQQVNLSDLDDHGEPLGREGDLDDQVDHLNPGFDEHQDPGQGESISDENDEGYLEALAAEEPPSWILEVDQEEIPPMAVKGSLGAIWLSQKSLQAGHKMQYAPQTQNKSTEGCSQAHPVRPLLQACRKQADSEEDLKEGQHTDTLVCNTVIHGETKQNRGLSQAKGGWKGDFQMPC